jgi:hypothetical protein
MSALESERRAQADAVRKARAIVAGELGVLEGCIPLAALAHIAVADWRADPDFVVVGAVASEVDDLPFGAVRAKWSSEALVRVDERIERYTRKAGPQVLEACRNIISRFSDTAPHNGAV